MNSHSPVGSLGSGGTNPEPLPIHHAASNPTITGGINGTNMSRVTSAGVGIGGPAKAHSGINGTTLRSKY
jgi:hypothetical protein